jgi:hypothetical protein
MSKYIELLGLNETDVENIATAYSGYALALQREADNDAYKLPIIASSWLIGALFKTLISPAEAKKSFHKAAMAYRELDWPIWRVCAICSGDDIYVKPNLEMVSDEELFYAVLQECANSETQERPKLLHFRRDIAGRIPGLNMPYNLTLKAIDDISGQVLDDNLKNVNDVFQRLGEIVEQYQADDHWRHLEGPILPFEPIALAIVIVILKVWKKENSIKELLLRNNSKARVLLEVAANLLDDDMKNDG